MVAQLQMVKANCILALGWFLFGIQSSALAARFEEPASVTAVTWAYIAVYGPPLLAYVVLRALTARLVLAFMMRRAPGLIGSEEALAKKEDTAVLNNEDVRFLELSAAKGILLNAPYDDRLARALDAGRRTWKVFWRSLFVFALASAAVYLFAVASKQAAVDAESTATTLIGIAEAAQLTGCVVIALALIILIVTVNNQYRIIGRVPVLSSATGLLLLAALAVCVGGVLSLPFYLYLLPPLCSAMMVGWGYGRIRRTARADGNTKLLILRVFGSDRNTSFVFGPLISKLAVPRDFLHCG